MSDMISRAEAIKALVTLHTETGVKTAQTIRIIRELPAEKQIIRCDECAFWDPLIGGAKNGVCRGHVVLEPSPRDGFCFLATQAETTQEETP